MTTLAAPHLLTAFAAPGAGASGGSPVQPGSRAAVAAPRGDGFPGGAALPLLVLLIASAAVGALLVYAVRMELGPMHRWLP